MKKVLDKNGIVAIAPTGQTTMDGTLPFISPSIVSLNFFIFVIKKII